MLIAHDGVAGNGKLAAEVKQVVLYRLELIADRLRELFREQYPEAGIEFVDRAYGLDARTVFSGARAVAEAGVAFVTGASDDLG